MSVDNVGLSVGKDVSFNVLDYYKQNSPSSTVSLKSDRNYSFVGSWNKKMKSAYHCFLSGCKIASNKGEFLYFVSLTMPSPFAVLNYRDIDGYEYELSLNKKFDVLKKRILRVWDFKLCYSKVRTAEGNGVIHFEMRTKTRLPLYLFRDWLRDNWAELTGAYMISFDECYGSVQDIAHYMVTQYVAGQGFIRRSSSDDWIFKGYVRAWREIKCVFLSSDFGMDFCVSVWDKWLLYGLKPDVLSLERDIINKNRSLSKRRFVDKTLIDVNLSPADEEYFKYTFAFHNRMWFLGKGGD